MYLIGFVIHSRQQLLFHITTLKDISDIHIWFSKNYHQEDFQDNLPLTKESIVYSLTLNEPAVKWFAGVGSIYGVVFGLENKIKSQYKIRYFNMI